MATDDNNDDIYVGAISYRFWLADWLTDWLTGWLTNWLTLEDA